MTQKIGILAIILIIISTPVYARENIYCRIQSTEIDTLRDPNHFYYLSDLSIRTIGQLILCDSIKPSDNFVTFSLLDTISKCTDNELKFFLTIFEKTMELADGALSEAVGSYALIFIENRPKLFIQHMDTIPKDIIAKWAYFTFYELYFSYSEDEIKAKCDELVINLKKVEKTENLNYFKEQIDEILKDELQKE